MTLRTVFLQDLAAMALMGLALQTGLTLPVLATLVFMLLRLLPHIQSANTQMTVILSRQAAVRAVLDLLDTRDKPYPKAGSLRCERFQREIRFERVCFSYRGKARPALRDIDLRIERGGGANRRRPPPRLVRGGSRRAGAGGNDRNP